MRNFVLLSATLVASASVFFVDDSPEVTAELAVEAALDQMREAKPASDACENCRGTGRIGDGNVVYDCPVCKGTGKSCGASCRKN